MLTTSEKFGNVLLVKDRKTSEITSVSFALASDDQLLLFSEEFTQILSSWPAIWVSGVVEQQGAYKALLLGSLAVVEWVS